jgi:ribosome-binding factor A
MTDHRNARLNEQFKREISQILTGKVRDPRVGHVLLTGVRVTPDLWLARVYFRPLDAERSLEEVQAGLEAAGPFIRRELGKVLRIRRMPELRFLHDTTLDSAQRIEEVLREVLPDSAGEEETTDGAVQSDEGSSEGPAGEGDL